MKTAKKSSQSRNSVFGAIFNDRRLTTLTLFVIVFSSIGAYLLSTSRAYDSRTETAQYAQLNNFRSTQGLDELSISECLAKKARSWALHMADTGQLTHSFADYFSCGGNKSGENIGNGSSPEAIFASLANSPQDRNNMLSRDYSSIGIGAVKSKDGTWWIVQSFNNCGSCDGAMVGEPLYSGAADKFLW